MPSLSESASPTAPRAPKQATQHQDYIDYSPCCCSCRTTAVLQPRRPAS